VNSHGAYSQSTIHSSSTITSAPLTPLDPMETESLRRMSIGSMSVILPAPGPGAFSLEEIDGLESTNPNELDHRRRSVVSLTVSVNKRLSMASRVSRGSSPSLRNHPLQTVSESLQYSESSHQSSRNTLNGSSATSNEKLNGQTNRSMSSISLEPPSEPAEPLSSGHPSPAVAPSMIENIQPEEQQPLEPSRISEEHVDPFFASQPADAELQKLEYAINRRSSPILSPLESQRLLSSNHRSLSLSTDLEIPIAQRPGQKSPLSTSERPSPTPSAQSPTGSESVYSVDYDASRLSFSSSAAPIKFVKLKRSGSQIASEKALASGLSTGGSGKTLQRLKDPSKFWPHNRRVDEKEEEELRNSTLEMISSQQNHEACTTEKQSNSYLLVSTHSAAQSPSTAVGSQEELGGFIASSDGPTPNAAALSHRSFMAEETNESIANLPADVALDVARLSDTGKLDLTLYNPQRSPPSINNDLSRNSLSSVRSASDSDSASRAALVKEIAANIALLPGPPVVRGAARGHVRTPSSERAARIEAHLESVGASRYKTPAGLNNRPEFLPYHGRNRSDYSVNFARQSDEDVDRTPMQGSFDGLSQSENSIDEESVQALPSSTTSYATFTPPVSRAPARWSEAGWKERQRSLNTLPLPSASITHSATRPIPFSATVSRSVSASSSSTPSIFKPVPSQPGTLYGRTIVRTQASLSNSS
jgi:hypothetical protein